MRAGAPSDAECSADGERAKVRFVFAGRFVDWKGVGYLVEAFARAAPRLNGAVLELIGDGPMRPEIEKRVREAGLDGRVVFRGWLSRPESAELMRGCDVFVMPSLRECGGTAILEAMAVGLPVIAAKWAGPAHYVTDETGVLVAPGTEEGFVRGLSEAMARLAADEGARGRMGEAGLRRVHEEFFDWDSKAERVIEILRETVARCGGAGGTDGLSAEWSAGALAR